MPGFTRIKGFLDVKAVEATCLAVVQRHAIMRTTYAYIDNGPVQTISPTIDWSLSMVDLSGLPETLREKEMQFLIKREAQRPFSLAHDLPWRVLLLRLTEADHVLSTVQHHISCDGWSIRLRDDEYSTLYAAFTAGQPSPLPELSIQYADYAYWQQEQLRGIGSESAVTYWQEKLAGFTPLQLPTDRPYPAVLTSKGASHYAFLASRLVNEVTNFCQKQNVTSFMVMLAALKAVLYRYTGQTDITIGSSFSNRDRPELESLIGFFVETIILRTDLAGDPTFAELVERVRQVTLEAYMYRQLPVEQIIANMRLNRDAGRNLLVQVLFEWQDWRQLLVHQVDLPELKTAERGSGIPIDTARFELALFAEMRPDGIECNWEYSTDLFDHGSITRLSDHFQTLLHAALKNPQQRLSALPLLTAAEQQQLLAWNQPFHNMTDEPLFVHRQFEAQAEKTPAAVAVVFADQHLTYQALNRRANQLAHHLQRLGVGAEVFVGLCLPRSPEMIIGLLAVLKAGGAYVPLDPAYPQERLLFMLQDAGVRVLLTQQELADRFAASERDVICLDGEWTCVDTNPATDLSASLWPTNAAYVIYTSGSTGTPKGVVIQHDNLAGYTATAGTVFNLTAADRVLQFASISFDTAAEEIYPCLTGGATLVLRTDEMLGPATPFWRTCREQAITVLDLPTVYWHELARSPGPEMALAKAVRLIIIGGEKAQLDYVNKWLEYRQTAGPQLVNTYGPTEATVVATAANLDTPLQGHVPIGRPIPNAQAFILDEAMHPVPVGVTGELYLGGHGLARGYFKRARLTAARFVPHPYSERAGERLYKTGDLAKYLPDGNIIFTGRRDHQVKIRGYRIELGEVEAALMELMAVSEAVVVAHEDTSGKQELAAYLVFAEDQTMEARELRARLQQKLPAYMVPANFIPLPSLPYTVSGKIDRQALPGPSAAGHSPAADLFVAPRTLSEQLLVEVWSALLGIEEISVYDNFFERGGHSMLAIQLMARLQDMLQIELSLQLFFQQPTIAGMAVTIDQMLLQEIENLSEEEALMLLESEA
jgi:amino acid adenylation domain-containing protein